MAPIFKILFPTCSIADRKWLEGWGWGNSIETERIGKQESIRRENDEGFLQALVGRIMQLPTMRTFVIVASDTF